MAGEIRSAPTPTPLVTIRLRLLEHDGRERMFAEFPRNAKLIAAVKSIPGARWSQRKRMWHLHPSNQVYLLLKEKVKGLAVVDGSQLKIKNKTGSGVQTSPRSGDTQRGMRDARPLANQHITESSNHRISRGFKPMPTEEQRKALDWYRKWMPLTGARM